LSLSAVRHVSNEAADAFVTAGNVRRLRRVLETARGTNLTREGVAQVLGDIAVLRSSVEEDREDIILESMIGKGLDGLGEPVTDVSDAGLAALGIPRKEEA